ncbi:helix-turn-helix domain-containing protein [Streptomyces sp. NPDC012769]|uniref:helix-turn-helix domain-containing protein n=1 Tax=Streptomyces sp. NPDC012769 TaxID=3364848 RepID=UPI0036AE1AC5
MTERGHRTALSGTGAPATGAAGGPENEGAPGAEEDAGITGAAGATDSLVLTDSTCPTGSGIAPAAGQFVRTVVLHIPRPSLPLRPDRVDPLLGRPIPTSGGTGAVLAGFLGTLLTHGADCRPEELSRMGSIALDLVTACLAQWLGALDEEPGETRAQATLKRIHSFIAHNLGDPDLTPQTIADRHHMSLRTLYELFSDQPASVAALIRRDRLERCHADLARPELRHHSVQVIASRWGFPNASAFSRAFRDAYGVSPSAHRATALGTGTAAGPGSGPSRARRAAWRPVPA